MNYYIVEREEMEMKSESRNEGKIHVQRETKERWWKKTLLLKQSGLRYVDKFKSELKDKVEWQGLEKK